MCILLGVLYYIFYVCILVTYGIASISVYIFYRKLYISIVKQAIKYFIYDSMLGCTSYYNIVAYTTTVYFTRCRYFTRFLCVCVCVCSKKKRRAFIKSSSVGQFVSLHSSTLYRLWPSYILILSDLNIIYTKYIFFRPCSKYVMYIYTFSKKGKENKLWEYATKNVKFIRCGLGYLGMLNKFASAWRFIYIRISTIIEVIKVTVWPEILISSCRLILIDSLIQKSR